MELKRYTPPELTNYTLTLSTDRIRENTVLIYNYIQTSNLQTGSQPLIYITILHSLPLMHYKGHHTIGINKNFLSQTNLHSFLFCCIQ